MRGGQASHHADWGAGQGVHQGRGHPRPQKGDSARFGPGFFPPAAGRAAAGGGGAPRRAPLGGGGRDHDERSGRPSVGADSGLGDGGPPSGYSMAPTGGLGGDSPDALDWGLPPADDGLPGGVSPEPPSGGGGRPEVDQSAPPSFVDGGGNRDGGLVPPGGLVWDEGPSSAPGGGRDRDARPPGRDARRSPGRRGSPLAWGEGEWGGANGRGRSPSPRGPLAGGASPSPRGGRAGGPGGDRGAGRGSVPPPGGGFVSRSRDARAREDRRALANGGAAPHGVAPRGRHGPVDGSVSGSVRGGGALPPVRTRRSQTEAPPSVGPKKGGAHGRSVTLANTGPQGTRDDAPNRRPRAAPAAATRAVQAQLVRARSRGRDAPGPGAAGRRAAPVPERKTAREEEAARRHQLNSQKARGQQAALAGRPIAVVEAPVVRPGKTPRVEQYMDQARGCTILIFVILIVVVVLIVSIVVVAVIALVVITQPTLPCPTVPPSLPPQAMEDPAFRRMIMELAMERASQQQSALAVQAEELRGARKRGQEEATRRAGPSRPAPKGQATQGRAVGGRGQASPGRGRPAGPGGQGGKAAPRRSAREPGPGMSSGPIGLPGNLPPEALAMFKAEMGVDDPRPFAQEKGWKGGAPKKVLGRGPSQGGPQVRGAPGAGPPASHSRARPGQVRAEREEALAGRARGQASARGGGLRKAGAPPSRSHSRGRR